MQTTPATDWAQAASEPVSLAEVERAALSTHPDVLGRVEAIAAAHAASIESARNPTPLPQHTDEKMVESERRSRSSWLGGAIMLAIATALFWALGIIEMPMALGILVVCVLCGWFGVHLGRRADAKRAQAAMDALPDADEELASVATTTTGQLGRSLARLGDDRAAVDDDICAALHALHDRELLSDDELQTALARDTGWLLIDGAAAEGTTLPHE